MEFMYIKTFKNMRGELVSVPVMKKIMLVFLLAGILLTGAVTQTYTMEIEKTGEAQMTQSSDLSLYDVGGSEMKAVIIAACKNITSPYSCKTENNKMIISTDMTPTEGGYVFEANYGIVSTNYKLKINSVPLNKFNEAIEKTGNIQSTGVGAIDLTQNNSQYSQAFRVVDLEMDYVVKMPGNIESISAGNVIGKMNGNTGEIDLLKVMEEGKPIILTSSEINWSAIVFILGIVVVIGLAVSVIIKKNKTK